MKFKIPFTISSLEKIKKRVSSKAKLFRGKKTYEGLREQLKNADAGISKEEYLAVCFLTFIKNIIIFSIIFIGILYFFSVKLFYIYGFGAAFLFTIFVFFSQINYPRVYNAKKARDIEKNLISAMQDMLVQLNSGVPLFKIMVNIAGSDYGAVSDDFGKIVTNINSGVPQIQALDELGNKSSSTYFRRVLWQISNGMRAGSDMSIVIKDNIDNLSKEQAIQIQNYGSKLNPLIMFYMLFTVIMPALGLTFLTIISSMVGLSSLYIKMLFFAIFIIVVFMQIMFLGMIKSRRPSLL